MKIVINSFVNNKIQLQHLLGSLQRQDNYQDFEIIVCIGGFYDLENYTIEKNENITYIHCNHNSIDFTGLIALSELFAQDTNNYYFYIHDTCFVGKQFLKKISEIDFTDLSISTIRIHQDCMFSMNMGIYSQKIINQFAPFLQETKNRDKDRISEYKNKGFGWEDFIFKGDKTAQIIKGKSKPTKMGPVDYYENGVERIIEYFENVDLYKIKTNYGK